MSRRFSVAVFLLLCFASEARAGPWQAHPVPATLPVRENPGSAQDIGSAADYLQTLSQVLIISRISVSVREGWTELIDGHQVKGVEVVDAAAESPVASAGIQSCTMAARTAPAKAGGFAAIILSPVIRLLRAIDRSLIFDERDVIFAVDGERIRNILELADRVQNLACGDRMYLTLARRGRRVQICVTASP